MRSKCRLSLRHHELEYARTRYSLASGEETSHLLYRLAVMTSPVQVRCPDRTPTFHFSFGKMPNREPAIPGTGKRSRSTSATPSFIRGSVAPGPLPVNTKDCSTGRNRSYLRKRNSVCAIDTRDWSTSLAAVGRQLRSLHCEHGMRACRRGKPHQGNVQNARGEEADEPGIVIEKVQRFVEDSD